MGNRTAKLPDHPGLLAGEIGKMLSMILLALMLSGCSTDGWQTASREPAGIAPIPEDTPEAIVQIYAADAWGWRGIFAVHTWIAVKPENARYYTLYEVVGWRVDDGHPALRVHQDKYPDRYWYGARPDLLWEKRGKTAEKLVSEIAQASESYPWRNEYRVFPGPNSNTFPAWIIAKVKGIDAQLPFRAIGSGYAGNDEQPLPQELSVPEITEQRSTTSESILETNY